MLGLLNGPSGVSSWKALLSLLNCIRSTFAVDLHKLNLTLAYIFVTSLKKCSGVISVGLSPGLDIKFST